MKILLKTRLKYPYDNNREKKNYIIYLQVYIFAVWESDAENHLLMLHLEIL